jgi:hypothetical protein
MAARGSQSNTMLYSLITLVGLFLAAASCAVFFYVKPRIPYPVETKRNERAERVSREQAAIARLVAGRDR